jgi:glycerophosphoryl diester phosphodiesterase
MLKLPKIIGHRGAAGYAPENTLESIATAADMGIEWVEFDVKLTKDQVPILFHDESLERTTNGGDRPVAEITFEEIRALEAGSWFADSFAGIKIPTLEEALEVVIEHGMGLNLEIKPCPGREKETAEAALDILSQVWDEPDKLLISSFSHVSMETALDMAPEYNRGFLLPKDWPENWQELAEYLQVSTFNVNGNKVVREDIDELLDLEKPILAYTINDPDRARILQGWGVDAFFSDEPDVIKDAIFSVH